MKHPGHPRRRELIALTALGVLPAITNCAHTENGAPESDASVVLGTDAATSDDASTRLPPCDRDDPACVSEILPCEAVDFCPAPYDVDPRHLLTGIWGVSADDIWAIGSGATILHYDGTSWIAVNTPPEVFGDTFRAIWGRSSTDFWITSSSTDATLHGTGIVDGKAQWSRPISDALGEVNGGAMNAIWGNGQQIRVGGVTAAVPEDGGAERVATQLYSPDNGLHWELSKIDERWDYSPVLAIWGSSATDLWISIDDGGAVPWGAGTLVHGVSTGDERLVWSVVDSQSPGRLMSLWGSSETNVWAVGEAGTIRRFAAGATRWVDGASPTKATLRHIWGSGPSDVWAVGDGGTIVHFDGQAWAPMTSAFQLGRKPNLHGVWGSGPNDVWVVGDGPLLHFTGKKRR